MNDDLDGLAALKAALHRATPAPDPVAKAEHLALALQNFDRTHQGSAAAPRPMSDRPSQAGFLTGVRRMFAQLSTRSFLAATTSAAALALAVVVILPGTPLQPPKGLQLPVPQPEEPRLRDAAPEMDGTTSAKPAPDVVAVAPPVLKPAHPGESQGLVADTAPLPQPAPMAGADSTIAPATGRALMKQAENASADTGTALGGATQGLVADSFAAAPAMEAAPAPAPEPMMVPAPDTEAFANAADNPLKITAESPVSTFSIDVDTASYAIIRQSLMAGFLPPPDAVRVEEMVNYFPYAYPAPDGDQAFRPSVTVLQTPWNPDTELVHIALQGRLPLLADRPALNLVFLIDTSGSMDDPAKLPLLKQSFRLMLGQLRPTDQVAIVTYAGSAGLVLPPTAASDRATIAAALDHLAAGGSTAGQEGLQQAYAVAAGMAGDGEVTRVVLATDGDFNVGLSDPEALKRFIADQRAGGTYLSVLGFGRGNLDDATMQALAQEGNGQAAYIDTLAEAQKVLVDQLSGALFPIADDVKIQVEWNPATVAEYRLIGYETRALNREDFNNDRVDAGEIGAGTAVTAIYEITPVGSPAQLSNPLRYQAETAAATTTELGFLKLRLKAPGASESRLIEVPINPDMAAVTDEVRFATAIAGFGQLLRGSPFLQDWGYGDAIALASGARGADAFGYRAEAVTLMRLAKTLSGN